MLLSRRSVLHAKGMLLLHAACCSPHEHCTSLNFWKPALSPNPPSLARSSTLSPATALNRQMTVYFRRALTSRVLINDGNSILCYFPGRFPFRAIINHLSSHPRYMLSCPILSHCFNPPISSTSLSSPICLIYPIISLKHESPNISSFTSFPSPKTFLQLHIHPIYPHFGLITGEETASFSKHNTQKLPALGFVCVVEGGGGKTAY